MKVFFYFDNFSIYIKFNFSILGIYLLSEALYLLRMEQFLLLINSSNFDYLFDHISEFQSVVTDDYLKPNEVRIKRNQCTDLAKEFLSLLEFTKQQSLKSVEFKYWSIFLDIVVPALRERDWCLHLSAVKRAITLFFSFDSTNYSGWTSLYSDNWRFLQPAVNSRIKCSPNGSSTAKII